ncbi:MAG: helix-turn-helix domain-containing protein [Flavobacteriaceae bacterium]|nr:AraC family transcriptional regulator [Flavobacteriaceae bacterium]
MEKLLDTSAEKRTAFVFQQNAPVLDPQSLSFLKKVWFQIVGEASLILYSFHQKQQLKYRDIVEKLHQDNTRAIKTVKNVEAISISEDIVTEILSKLKQFEADKKYIDKDLDLPGLAKSLGTNHSYLSRVINQVKNKSFKNYLNDLRIEYAYIDLQTNPKMRQYTIEAIASDVGFKSAESFSKKFKARYGMYPSVFLRKLNEGV